MNDSDLNRFSYLINVIVHNPSRYENFINILLKNGGTPEFISALTKLLNTIEENTTDDVVFCHTLLKIANFLIKDDSDYVKHIGWLLLNLLNQRKENANV